ncbi:MAG: SagB/ThcOx family dehydrogenase [Candidatus Izemoplasmatales bacterium]|jgi:SagB-type dehydrogenase family enzyme
MKERLKRNRETIKPNWLELYTLKSAKRQGLSRPNQFIQIKKDVFVYDLEKDFQNIKQKTLNEVIRNRRSLREYEDVTLNFEEFSYLIWETLRLDSFRENAVFRTIPTAGATNSMETYIYINNVENMEKGIYLYLQDRHQLALIKREDNIETLVNEALLRQLRGAQAVFFFTCVPERTEYKYDFCAHKMIAIEAGHACQNLSLAAEVVDSGICAICAYDQSKVDDVLGIDGENQFTIYCATVGKKKIK